MTNSASRPFYFVLYANGTDAIISRSRCREILTAPQNHFIYVIDIFINKLQLNEALKLRGILRGISAAFYANSNQIPPLFSR